MCLLLLLSLVRQLDASSSVLLEQTWMARNLNNILVPDTSNPFMVYYKSFMEHRLSGAGEMTP